MVKYINLLSKKASIHVYLWAYMKTNKSRVRSQKKVSLGRILSPFKNPNNQNASYNLELTKIKTIDQIEALPDLFYKKWWDDLVSIFSTKNWQIFAILSIWIILIIQISVRFTNFKKKYLLRFFILLTLILFSINYSSYQENYRTNNAIIFSSSVAVNSAPTNKSTSLFSLHLGTKVEMIDEIGNWVNIKIANGNSGWIQKSHCKVLD